MNAVAFTFCCGGCGRQFEGPEAPENSYGQFVLRSETSDAAAFLDAPNDSVFFESYHMVRSDPQTAKMSGERKARIQQQVFALTRDPTSGGEMLKIGVHPRCPHCGSREMGNWQEISPPRLWPLPSVTHKKWNALTKQQRVELIGRGIQSSLKAAGDCRSP
ncbi:MAG: hypothetical protein KA118_13125 [Verrucomicrobia bacterium]|nr:hypothetical protein [Verrucomicrobiota bacterium]